ncbi:MAG: squalene--hopene cyclase [Planctomycetaceae bacterium]|jgi:squalene-hopene/tetraprenyl-beta-curcumene cyclase|nr:squalene--hopene cyclase [Planctomycetaceae bacterium]
MFSGIAISRIQNAYEKLSSELLAQQNADGYWTGRLSDSALAAAVAVSALSVFRNAVRINFPGNDFIQQQTNTKNPLTENEFNQIESAVRQGVMYLVEHQNPDGGWGDTDKSVSNPSTTLLVKSALLLSDVYDSAEQSTGHGIAWNAAAKTAWHNTQVIGWSMDLLGKADCYLRDQGGIEFIKRTYGSDRSFAAPILTNAALAGLVPWREVPQLPFERAALPMSLYRFANLHVVSYALPALVAVGLVRFRRYKSNPLSALLRNAAVGKTLRLIEAMQPASGGYLEAVPLTAFTVMCLADCAGKEWTLEHPVIINGLRFLLNTVRENGAWAIDTNLATWLTSQSISALTLKEPDSVLSDTVNSGTASALRFLLAEGNQHTKRHPFTGAAPGGWGWTHLSGAVPDADDTAAALSALSAINAEKHIEAAAAGIRWLLQLRNRNGGIPTFCRGWGVLPFDQSSTDITANTLRAFQKWLPLLQKQTGYAALIRKMKAAQNSMLSFLYKKQRLDGSWLPLWFGNQFESNGENAVYGTAKVLAALAETAPLKHSAVQKGIAFLLQRQNQDGGWGTYRENFSPQRQFRSQVRRPAAAYQSNLSTIEETAVVIEALAAFAESPETAAALQKGLEYLLDKIEKDKHTQPAPIGLYFSTLWYYEKLYPLIFSAAALKRIVKTNR